MASRSSSTKASGTKSSSAKSSSARDPFDQWRAWLDRAERQMNKTLNEAMSSEHFGKAQGRLMELMLGMQRSTNETARRYFETLNMPTRADVLNLAERLDQIEQRLGGLEHSMAKLAGVDSPARKRPQPKRTKRPPAADSSSSDRGKATSTTASARSSAKKKAKKAKSKIRRTAKKSPKKRSAKR